MTSETTSNHPSDQAATLQFHCDVQNKISEGLNTSFISLWGRRSQPFSSAPLLLLYHCLQSYAVLSLVSQSLTNDFKHGRPRENVFVVSADASNTHKPHLQSFSRALHLPFHCTCRIEAFSHYKLIQEWCSSKESSLAYSWSLSPVETAYDI